MIYIYRYKLSEHFLNKIAKILRDNIEKYTDLIFNLIILS